MVFRTHHNAAGPQIGSQPLHLLTQFGKARALCQAKAVPRVLIPVLLVPHIHRHSGGRRGCCQRTQSIMKNRNPRAIE